MLEIQGAISMYNLEAMYPLTITLYLRIRDTLHGLLLKTVFFVQFITRRSVWHSFNAKIVAVSHYQSPPLTTYLCPATILDVKTAPQRAPTLVLQVPAAKCSIAEKRSFSYQRPPNHVGLGISPDSRLNTCSRLPPV